MASLSNPGNAVSSTCFSGGWADGSVGYTARPASYTWMRGTACGVDYWRDRVTGIPHENWGGYADGEGGVNGQRWADIGEDGDE